MFNLGAAKTVALTCRFVAIQCPLALLIQTVIFINDSSEAADWCSKVYGRAERDPVTTRCNEL